jgi:transposase-like protein
MKAIWCPSTYYCTHALAPLVYITETLPVKVNAQAYVPRKDEQAEVAADIRMVLNATDRTTAGTYLAKIVQKYQKSASRLADWMEKNIPESLTIFAFPTYHERRLRTSNCLERLNREIRRRTRVVSIFPNEAACLRLISAILMEIDEEWQTGRVYLTFAGEEGRP